ncbi:MAG: helix-turn-helix transcriptional regulator [Bacteroidales bacterium]|nr:helix-turn-helix transcriptional regulator [Bacteroidales bacterium]
MKERIQEYMDIKSINAGELATILEVQRSNISHILNGRNKPSAALIEKMLHVFPDLNARWLLTGEGSMLDQANPVDVDSKRNSQANIIVPDIEKTTNESREELRPDRHSRIEHEKINTWDDTIERVVLFHKDGSFTSYFNRNRK